MAMSNAQKQAAYRRKAIKEGDRERLQMVVSLHTKRALERLARHWGLSQVAALERILDESQQAVLANMGTLEQERYYRD